MDDSVNKKNKKRTEDPASESDTAKTTATDEGQVSNSVAEPESDPSNSAHGRKAKTLEFLKTEDPKTKSKRIGFSKTVDKTLLLNKLINQKEKSQTQKVESVKDGPKVEGWENIGIEPPPSDWSARPSVERLFAPKSADKEKTENEATREPVARWPKNLEKLKQAQQPQKFHTNIGKTPDEYWSTPSTEKLFASRNEKEESNEDLNLDPEAEEAEKKADEERRREAQRLEKLRHTKDKLKKLDKNTLRVKSFESKHKASSIEKEENGNADENARGLASSESAHDARSIEKEDATETKTGNEQTPRDIFGYQSKLYSAKHLMNKVDESPIVFELETKSEETSDERDMTWLIQLSQTNEKKVKFALCAKPMKRRLLWLFWWLISIGGRMPFHFVEKSNSKGESQIMCEMKKKGISFCVFVITTLFLFLLTMVSTLNLLLIIFEKEVKGEPHNQLEKLLLEKNKVTAAIFLMALVQALLSSIYILVYGDTMAKYMTNWRNTLDQFNFKASTGITAVIIIYIVWFISFFVAHVITFFLSISNAKANASMEGIHLLTTIVFRSFVTDVLIQIKEIPNGEPKFESSDQLRKYGIFIVCLGAYVLYCSTNFVVMAVLYSIGIKNMAAEWNFRLRLILQQYRIKKSEHFLLDVNESLTYQTMFDWHRSVVRLVNEYSNVFYAILATFYLAVAFVLGGELYDLSIFTVGQEVLAFNLNESAQLYDFEKGNGHFMYLCLYMSQTIGLFLFVSFFLADAGSEVMNGLITTTRHSYMNCKSTRQRRFFMSLSMSFSARKPHLLGVGGVVSIDKSFIIGFLAFFLYYYSVMIQTQHERILTLPIVLECPHGSGQFCVASKIVKGKDVGKINDMNDAASIRFQNRSMSRDLIDWTTTRPNIRATLPTSTTTTTTASTTTDRTTRFTGIDSCHNLAPGPSSHQKAVRKNINLAPYILCCYHTSCNKLLSDLDTCNYIPNPSNNKIPPYTLSSLTLRVQSCFGTIRPSYCGAIDLDGCFCGEPRTMVVDEVDSATGTTGLGCP